MTHEEAVALVKECRTEIEKRIIGQKEAVDGILTGVLCSGHILLEGVPGLAKTLAVKTFAETADLSFKRIQFTPDLLPADVSGTMMYETLSGKFSVKKGPVFANVVLADEINRAPAKVQSALLEAMAEKQVTIGDESLKLPEPFFVLATQNPIEQEGTYNLPEAELDRFLLKVKIGYPEGQDEIKIVTESSKIASTKVSKILDAKKILDLQKVVEDIKCEEKIIEYMVSVVAATRPLKDNQKTASRFSVSAGKKDDISKYISFGASPRSGIALLKASKANALFNGRDFVLPEDVKAVAVAVLRHRIVLSYEAAADGVSSDELIEKILDVMPLP